MNKRVERGLNIANITACTGAVATAATDAAVPGLGAARAAISGALAALSLRNLGKEDLDWVVRLAQSLDTALYDSHLSENRKIIVCQLIGQHPLDVTDVAEGNHTAETIAENARTRAEEAAKDDRADPAWGTEQALTDFENILRSALTDFLTPQTEQDAVNAALLQRTDRLLEMAEQKGQTDRLRDEGITEKAIIRLAQRVSATTDDLGQAWLELQNAMDIAVRVQAEGGGGSNHGEFVDRVLARVAELARQGVYATAGAEVEAALDAQQATTLRLFDSGVELALLDGNTDNAADLLIRKAESAGKAGFEDLRSLQDDYYVKGRDQGVAQPLDFAIALARRLHTRSHSADERGAALNELGTSLATLGQRESGTERLEQAATAYRNALEEYTRDRVPLDWAIVQTNLANRELVYFDKTGDAARLDAAEACLQAARAVFAAGGATQYLDIADRISTRIAARRT